MKTELLIGFLGTLLVCFLTFLYIYKYQTQISINNHGQIFTTPPPSGSTVPGVTSTGAPLTLTIQEVQKHNQSSDCWAIVNNKVYNVTSYLNNHPGGPQTILPYCGADMTVAFDTKGGRGSHSSVADQELASLLIGQLGSTVNTQTVQSLQNLQISNAPVRRLRRIEDD